MLKDTLLGIRLSYICKVRVPFLWMQTSNKYFYLLNIAMLYNRLDCIIINREPFVTYLQLPPRIDTGCGHQETAAGLLL